MKNNSLILYTILFSGLFLFGFSLIINYSTNLNLEEFFTAQNSVEKIEVSNKTCTDIDPIPGLNASSDSHLTKLSEYQEVCGSLATKKMMIFIDMPKDSKDAKAKANNIVSILKEFDRYKITPLIIVEPVTEWGLVDFTEFGGGFYDQWIDEYFKEIKSQGITDEMMGVWVPFPEANLPYWNRSNATPVDFGNVVNRYLKLLKNSFPFAEASILLNSATYESTDFNWERGEYVSLIPYVAALDSSLIDSFGIQGFPWRNDASASNIVRLYEPRQYINSRLAIEAANYLNVKEIWFNTGTFSRKFTLDSSLTVYEDSTLRNDLLDGTITEALNVKEKGFNIWINLFAEDKSEVTEATDWSYWNDYRNDDPNKYIFKSFIRQLYDNQIEVSLFDKSKTLPEQADLQ